MSAKSKARGELVRRGLARRRELGLPVGRQLKATVETEDMDGSTMILKALAKLEGERQELAERLERIDAVITGLRAIDSWQAAGSKPARAFYPKKARSAERVIDRVVAVLKKAGEPMTARQLYKEIGGSLGSLQWALHTFARSGTLQRVSRGTFTLA